jgi:hypothetical protein
LTPEERKLVENHLTISLKDYIELRFAQSDKEIVEAKRLAAIAVNEAKDLMSERLKKSDESKDEMKEDIKKLQEIADIAKGKASQASLNITLFLTLINLILATIALLK